MQDIVAFNDFKSIKLLPPKNVHNVWISMMLCEGKCINVKTKNIVTKLAPPKRIIPDFEQYTLPVNFHMRLDLTQPSCVELKNFLDRMDMYFSSETSKHQMFDSMSEDYTYVPVVKNNNGNYYCKFNYLKNNKKIATELYDEGMKICPKNEDDFSEYVGLGSTVEYTIIVGKLWINTDSHKYGVTIHLDKVDVINKAHN